MYQIGHRTEGSVPFNKSRSIELVDATDEMGGRRCGLHDERGRSSPFV